MLLKLPLALTLTTLLIFQGFCHPAESVLPPVEELLPDRGTLSTQVKVLARDFHFQGNTVFSDEELANVVKNFVDRELTSEELEEARRTLTLHYIEKGYINSGAILPDQAVEDGIITVEIVEGELTEIEISGNRRTKTGYIRRRVELGAARPLNLLRLKRNLEIIDQSPVFERVDAELQPGTNPGQSRLKLDVEESRPFHAALQFDNVRPPSVGAERFSLLLWHHNLTGVADSLWLRYGLTKNGLEDIELAGLDDIEVSYAHPVTAYDTRLKVGFTRTDTLLIEEPFQELDITGETETYSVAIRHPIYRTLNTEFALSLTGEVRSNKTELRGEPFSFVPGAENGETSVTPLRFAQGWTTRDERRAITARSTFTFGLPILGATEHGDPAEIPQTLEPTEGGALPDGEFLAWLGQFQYVQRLWSTTSRVIFRLTTQLADASLLSMEKFGIGGMYTVRGYRENQVVRDNGVVASLEMRVPLLHDRTTHEAILQLAPFVDFGYSWDTQAPRRETDLPSVGLGVLFNIRERVDARVYWGYAFRDFEHVESNVQDSGIHFCIVANFF